jgi:hypothetical protein
MLTELNALYRSGQINAQEPRSLFDPAEVFNTRWLLRALLVEWQQGRVPALASPALTLIGGSYYSDVPVRLPMSDRVRPFLDLASPDPVAELHAIAGQIQVNRSKREVKLARNFSQIVVFEVVQGSTRPAVPFWRKVAWLADLLWNSRRWGNYAARYIVLYPQQLQLDAAQFDPNAINQSAERWRIDNGVLTDFASQFSAPPFTWRDVLVSIMITQLSWEEALAGPSAGALRDFYARCREFTPRV